MLVVNSDLVSDSPHQIQTSNFKKKKKRFRPRSHKAQALYTHLLAAPIQERIGSSGWMYGGEPADGGGDGTDDASTGSWLSSAGVSLLLASSCFWSSSLSSDLHIHIWQGKQNITSTIYIYIQLHHLYCVLLHGKEIWTVQVSFFCEIARQLMF